MRHSPKHNRKSQPAHGTATENHPVGTQFLQSDRSRAVRTQSDQRSVSRRDAVGGTQPPTHRPRRRRTRGLLQELLERIHKVFTRHHCAEYVSPDVGVHSLLAGELQDLRANLERGKTRRRLYRRVTEISPLVQYSYQVSKNLCVILWLDLRDNCKLQVNPHVSAESSFLSTPTATARDRADPRRNPPGLEGPPV